MDSSPHPSVAERLSRLAPDQRAAATAPPGPVLCVAPAGSGKTTTLVARVAWLVDRGADPGSVCIVAFNKRAAEELTHRLDGALALLGVPAGSVRVRTFHALGREILRDAGVAVEPLADRDEVLRSLYPGISKGDRGRLDLAFSRLKLDLRVSAEEVATDPEPGPIARAFVAYERAVAEGGGVDFDDLIVRALTGLRRDERLLNRWRSRTQRLLVDEAQDLDRTQLELALLLAAPENDVFLVGDDDQTIYSWRLADVRRVLGLAAALPGLQRVDLETNYRCPPAAVARAVRLVEHNRERFAKRILAGSRAGGRVVLAPDAADDAVRVRRAMAQWPADGSSRAVLARTNRELLIAVVAALELQVPFRAPDLALAIEDPRLDDLLARAAGLAVAAEAPGASSPGPLPALGRLRADLLAAEAADPPPDPDEPAPSDLATALLGWAAVHHSVASLASAVADRRRLLTELRRDDASLTLATAHGTKGLEWDHVVVLTDGFPGRRSVADATEPERALEEERRLAYVAWTRARRSLTLLYDPETPSPFLREAFDPEELAPPARRRAA
jgi:DNA helicase-2/ATP-dependent DNA helicase PcrA